MRHWFSWQRIAIVIGIVVVVYALNLAQSANSNAHEAVDESKVAALQAKTASSSLAAAEVKRAQGSCKSSTELRKLLSDVKNIVLGDDGLPRNEGEAKFAARIDVFVKTNPNCNGVTLPKE